MKRRLLLIALAAAGLTASASAVGPRETWECESENNGFDQILSVDIEDGKLVGVHYTGMAPIGDGTKTLCSLEASRGKPESEWKGDGDRVEISLKESANPEDKLIVTKVGPTYTLTIDASPYNCGHSTPMAEAIAITKNKKICSGIIMP